jgi:hypothetical protein
MRRSLLACGSLLVCLLGARVASATEASEEAPAPREPVKTNGDLFPKPLHMSVSAASGVPFFGIAEVGLGFTNGVAVGVVAGITPSVWTAGVRPRFRVATGEHTALVIVAPLLYYPSASAPGPGNLGATSWLLTRPELFLDVSPSDRWHVAGGMGIVAAASIDALKSFAQGNDFAMPAYNGATETKKGFAGGVWNTVSTRGSYAIDRATHLFAEGSVVLKGIKPADDVGGPPIVVTIGAQHTF